MQLFDPLVPRATAYAFSVSLLAALTACSSSESNSSDSTASTTGSSGGNGTSDTSDTSDTGGTSGAATTSSAETTSAGGTATASTTGSTSQGSGGSAGMASGGAAGAEGCAVDVAAHELDAGIHVTECSLIDYSTNPPSSGEHYDVWAAYQTYDFPVPRGYWVHSLEHGAVVFSYNCRDGCPDEVAQVEALIASLPVDPRCVPYDRDRQVILTRDPLLDTRWAMSSWGHTLRADCIDEAAFRDFYESNVAHGPEDICGGGSVLTEATLAPDCGE